MASAKVVDIKKKVVPGASFRIDALLTLPNPYVQASGVPLVASDFGLSRISSIRKVFPANLAAGVNTPVPIPTYTTDGTNDIASIALHFIVASTGVEVADNADLSAQKVIIGVYGV